MKMIIIECLIKSRSRPSLSTLIGGNLRAFSSSHIPFISHLLAHAIILQSARDKDPDRRILSVNKLIIGLFASRMSMTHHDSHFTRITFAHHAMCRSAVSSPCLSFSLSSLFFIIFFNLSHVSITRVDTACSADDERCAMRIHRTVQLILSAPSKAYTTRVYNKLRPV